MNDCPHNNIEVCSRMIYKATLEEPAEYLEWGICTDCGAHLDLSDIPDKAKAKEGSIHPPMRGMPSEFHD